MGRSEGFWFLRVKTEEFFCFQLKDLEVDRATAAEQISYFQKEMERLRTEFASREQTLESKLQVAETQLLELNGELARVRDERNSKAETNAAQSVEIGVLQGKRFASVL